MAPEPARKKVKTDSGAAFNKKDLKGATASLLELLEEREKALQQREEDLNRRESLLQAAANGAKPDDILYLNVGGCTQIAVSRKTLTLINGSVLGAMFSKNWEDGLHQDSEGNIFIDQDPESFMKLLTFLRSIANDVHDLGVNPPTHSEPLDRLLDYYDMKMVMYPVDIKKMTGSTDDDNVVIEKSYIATRELASFILVAGARHGRSIRSFKIWIGEISMLNIGWTSNSSTPLNNNSVAVQLTEPRGICWYGSHCAESVLNQVSQDSTILFETNASESDLLEKYTFTILDDGAEQEEKYPMVPPQYAGNRFPTPCTVPYISLKGEIQILAVDYY